MFLSVLKDGLNENFAEVDVSVVDCPDLQRPPWNLVATGEGRDLE